MMALYLDGEICLNLNWVREVSGDYGVVFGW